MLWGIDVSGHQGAGFPMARVRDEGFSFVFIKATEGSGYYDPQFGANLANARAAGLLCAGYHYQRGDALAIDQVNTITRQVPRDCPVILDVEANGGNTAITWDITRRLWDAGYRTPLLYLPQWFWQQIGSPDLRGLPPLWYSRYPSSRAGYASAVFDRNASWLNTMWAGYGGLGVEVLQFTDQGTVAGRSPIDCNAYRGNRQQLAALLGDAGPGGIEAMSFDDHFQDWAGNDQTVASWMNHVDQRLAELHDGLLSARQSRYPGSDISLSAVDAVFDNNALVYQLPGMITAAAQTDPQALAEALRPALGEVIGPVIRDAVTEALGADNDATAEAIVDAIGARLATGERSAA